MDADTLEVRNQTFVDVLARLLEAWQIARFKIATRSENKTVSAPD